MTHIVHVDGLTFEFDDGWKVTKYDDWAFYRNQFSKMGDGIKSVDLIAISPDAINYLVEVKDYRRFRRTKPSDIGDEVFSKIFGTLSALLPAKVNANLAEERRFAEDVLCGSRLRVVLHLEQPKEHSKLFPRSINPADVQLKLRQCLKPVDAHPLVVEIGGMCGLTWVVR